MHAARFLAKVLRPLATLALFLCLLLGARNAAAEYRFSVASALAALAASATSLEHLSGSCLDKASRDKAKSLKESVALSQSVVQLTLRSFEAQTAQSMEGEGKCDQAFSSVSAGMQQRITVARSTLQKTIRTNLGLLKSYREDLSGSNLRFVSQGQDQGACIVKGLAQLGVTRQAYAESLSALDLVADDLAETIGRMEVYRSELAVLQSRCRSEHTDGAAPTSASALSRHGDGGKKIPKGQNVRSESTITGEIKPQSLPGANR